MLSEKILVPQSILQGEQDGALVQERRNQLEQGLVIRCLQRNQNQVARPDGVSGLVALHSGNVKIFLFPTDADARTFDFSDSASQQEMIVAPAVSELAAIKTADRAC